MGPIMKKKYLVKKRREIRNNFFFSLLFIKYSHSMKVKINDKLMQSMNFKPIGNKREKTRPSSSECLLIPLSPLTLIKAMAAESLQTMSNSDSSILNATDSKTQSIFIHRHPS
uniref:Uncharacterized protein n=1 Tax=Lepeophtheirus salmonis TaxID=72036 RepID=A0A0K2UWF3_LEPSM